MTIENKKILVAGGGGFIGGHLVKKLLSDNNELIVVDLKPKEYWFQYHEEAKNFSYDLKDYQNCLEVTKNIDYVFNMACNMGGMGFIEETGAAQHYRDARILPIYEGTNGIQALDLLRRKLTMEDGKAFHRLLDHIDKKAEECLEIKGEELSSMGKNLHKATKTLNI